MKILRLIICFIAVLTAAIAAQAQQVRLISPQQAVQGQRFQVAIKVTNIQASAPAPPTIENCTLLYGPSTSTMQSIEYVNGQQSSKVEYTYTYTYRADKASTVTVPAVTVSAQNGQKHTTASAKITILPPDQNAQQAQGGQGQQNGRPAAGGESSFSPDDMFVRINLNKSQVYEQEPVVATVKVYTRCDISMFRIITQPTFEGFLSEELDVPNKVEMEHVNGKNYYTMVLKRCLLYPQKAGKLTINSGKYEVTLSTVEYVSAGFFPVAQRVEKNVNTQTNTASVNVMELPEPRPADFSGAVGSYTVSADLKPLELRTNESATYTLKIQGTGNVKYLTVPALNLPAGFEQFTPQTDIDASCTGSNMSGTYEVTYTLVPQEPGDFTIDGWDYCYFDPQAREYKRLPVPEFRMKVAKGLATAAATEQKEIAKGMTDILHIKSSAGTLDKHPQMVALEAWYWWLYVLSAAILLVLIAVYRRQLKRRADVAGRRQAGANKAAAKRLRRAKEAMKGESPDRFYDELAKALFGYIGDKLRIPSSQLLRDNISEALTSHGVDAAATAEVIDILDQCEMARFTPEHSDSEMEDLYRRAMEAIKQIDKTKSLKK